MLSAWWVVLGCWLLLLLLDNYIFHLTTIDRHAFIFQLFCDVEENICRQWNRERGERGESTYDEKMWVNALSHSFNSEFEPYWGVYKSFSITSYRTDLCISLTPGSMKLMCTSNRFSDLVGRFERPDRRNRWDSPLFELVPFRGNISYDDDLYVLFYFIKRHFMISFKSWQIGSWSVLYSKKRINRLKNYRY